MQHFVQNGNLDCCFTTKTTKNNKDVNTNFYNLYIFVNLEHLCVKALSYNEKQQGMNTKTFTICPFSINFEHLCVKNCLQRKTARLWTLKLFNLFIFINFEHLCVKTLFYTEKQQGCEHQNFCNLPIFINFEASVCENSVLQRKTTRVWTQNVNKLFNFSIFEHLCNKLLFCSE